MSPGAAGDTSAEKEVLPEPLPEKAQSPPFTGLPARFWLRVGATVVDYLAVTLTQTK